MTTMKSTQQPALIVIDAQRGFDDPVWGAACNNPQAEGNIARLLAAWRQDRRPIHHVQHMSRNPGSPLRPGQEGNEFKPAAAPSPASP